MLALFIVFINRGTRTRIRTEISQLSVATEYKPAVLPLNYPGDVFVIAPLWNALLSLQCTTEWSMCQLFCM